MKLPYACNLFEKVMASFQYYDNITIAEGCSQPPL